MWIIADTLKASRSAVPIKGKHLVFLQPTVIAKIEFRRWIDDGNLRHASHAGAAAARGTTANMLDLAEAPERQSHAERAEYCA